jgi:hypothetical protein
VKADNSWFDFQNFSIQLVQQLCLVRSLVGFGVFEYQRIFTVNCMFINSRLEIKMDIKSPARTYKYIGDRLTASELKGAICQAVTVNGKCIRRGASMLVSFENKKHIVLARLLRKQKHE